MRTLAGNRSVGRADHWKCKYCKQEICFDSLDTGSSGKLIPLNHPDRSRHQCTSPENPYNQRAVGRGGQ